MVERNEPEGDLEIKGGLIVDGMGKRGDRDDALLPKESIVAFVAFMPTSPP